MISATPFHCTAAGIGKASEIAFDASTHAVRVRPQEQQEEQRRRDSAPETMPITWPITWWRGLPPSM
jgi:hypothetical protein